MQLAGLPTMQRVAGGAVDMSGAGYSPAIRDVLVEALLASGSDLTLLPVQDVFGWRDRINEPATVTDENWTFRLPWPVDRLDEVPEARDRPGASARVVSRSTGAYNLLAMATLRPFRALRPNRSAAPRRRGGALRRRQHRRSASARGRQSAELSARLARGDRVAAWHRSRTRTTCTIARPQTSPR